MECTNDGPGNPTHFFFSEASEISQPDAFIQKGEPGGGCAQIDRSVTPPVITLSADALASPDLPAIIAHELGHLLGLAEATADPDCGTSETIMRGHKPESCEQVLAGGEITQADVRQANVNFDPTTRQQACTASVRTVAHQPAECNATVESNCYANGGTWDPNTCTCNSASGCDQTQVSACVSNGGSWDDTSCSCSYPQYYYSGGPTYYCYYEQHCYYTMASDGYTTEYSEVECYWEKKGCWYSY